MLNFELIKKYKIPVILLVAGFILILVLNFIPEKTVVYSQEEEIKPQETYDTFIEKKLEKVLASAEGVGGVKVAVTLKDNGEILPYEEKNVSLEATTETDNQGGNRNIDTKAEDIKPSIIKNQDGSESALITKNFTPEISGVVVCAKGADSFVVKEKIIKAVKALCNIEINQIEILPMD